MGLHRRTSRALTITLAVLLAWPWNVVPSGLELSPEVAPDAREALHVPGERWVQRSRPSSAWDLASDPAISPTCDEEEGDQREPAPVIANPCLDPGRHVSIVVHLGSALHSPTALLSPHARLYRLRC